MLIDQTLCDCGDAGESEVVILFLIMISILTDFDPEGELGEELDVTAEFKSVNCNVSSVATSFAGLDLC